MAYRFFATERRKFIVADAPGHEQYTRNMATGASTADLALIVVNAQAGITRQTRRHSLIVSTLGVRRLVLAVNKMDLVDWSEAAFRAIETEFRSFADALGVRDIVCIPLAARSGDSIARRSPKLGWYRGPTLLDYLEEVEVGPEPHAAGFRLPVQLVNRPTRIFAATAADCERRCLCRHAGARLPSADLPDRRIVTSTGPSAPSGGSRR